MSSKKLFVICNLGFVILFCGCQKNPPHTAAAGTRSAHAILAERHLKEADDNISTIKALARAELVSQDRQWRTDVILVIERPDHIRVDAMDSLADVWVSAGTDGKKLWLWLPQKRKLYRGAATAGNLKKLANFDWEISEFASIVAGLVPNARLAELLEVNRREGHYVLVNNSSHLWIDPKSHKPIRLVRYKETKGDKPLSVQYDVNFGDYISVGDAEFPRSIDVLFPGKSCELHLEFVEIELNAKVSRELFNPQEVWRGHTVEMDK